MMKCSRVRNTIRSPMPFSSRDAQCISYHRNAPLILSNEAREAGAILDRYRIAKEGHRGSRVAWPHGKGKNESATSFESKLQLRSFSRADARNTNEGELANSADYFQLSLRDAKGDPRAKHDVFFLSLSPIPSKRFTCERVRGDRDCATIRDFFGFCSLRALVGVILFRKPYCRAEWVSSFVRPNIFFVIRADAGGHNT